MRHLYKGLVILFVVFLSCDLNNSAVNCIGLKAEIENAREEIKTLAATSECTDEFECRYIAFGSKPCGGPWEYLIYSTSIDTENLEKLVQQFNEIELTYNQNCDAISDCAVPTPPTGFTCVDNACVPVF